MGISHKRALSINGRMRHFCRDVLGIIVFLIIEISRKKNLKKYFFIIKMDSQDRRTKSYPADFSYHRLSLIV